MRGITFLAVALLASELFGQYLIERPVVAQSPTVDIIEAIESVSTDEFSFNGVDVVAHFAEDHQGARLLKKLHEYIHQQIERLRPAGVHSYIVVEASPEEYAAFMSGFGGDLESKSWVIIRKDKRIGQRLANFVVIGKTHYSHVGFLTRERLQSFIDQSRPRVQRQAKWKIQRIVMHTQDSCDPCKAWLRVELPKIGLDGVPVSTTSPAGRATPWFEVQYCDDDKCKTLVFSGYTSYETMKAAM